jgi:hypothetical protein
MRTILCHGGSNTERFDSWGGMLDSFGTQMLNGFDSWGGKLDSSEDQGVSQ